MGQSDPDNVGQTRRHPRTLGGTLEDNLLGEP